MFRIGNNQIFTRVLNLTDFYLVEIPCRLKTFPGFSAIFHTFMEIKSFLLSKNIQYRTIINLQAYNYYLFLQRVEQNPIFNTFFFSKLRMVHRFITRSLGITEQERDLWLRIRLKKPLMPSIEFIPNHISEIPKTYRNFNKETNRPIILLPGLIHHSQIINLLKEQFDRANYLAFPLDFKYNAQGSLEESAQDLMRKVKILKQVTGAEKFDIAGFSYGGVIIKYCIDQYGLGDSIQNFIALASPLGGSLTSVVLKRAYPEACFTKEFLEHEIIGLNRAAKTMGNNVRYTAIIGVEDQLTVPYTKGFFSNPSTIEAHTNDPKKDRVKNYLINNLKGTHEGIISSENVFRIILNRLEDIAL